MKPEHKERLARVFDQVPKNGLGVLFRCAFYDPFEPTDDAIDRIAHMSDELVVDSLERALPKAANYFSIRGRNA